MASSAPHRGQVRNKRETDDLVRCLPEGSLRIFGAFLEMRCPVSGLRVRVPCPPLGWVVLPGVVSHVPLLWRSRHRLFPSLTLRVTMARRASTSGATSKLTLRVTMARRARTGSATSKLALRVGEGCVRLDREWYNFPICSWSGSCAAGPRRGQQYNCCSDPASNFGESFSLRP